MTCENNYSIKTSKIKFLINFKTSFEFEFFLKFEFNYNSIHILFENFNNVHTNRQIDTKIIDYQWSG